MDPLALLCNLHGNGPVTLARLRRARCDSLGALLNEFEAGELAEVIGESERHAARFLREGGVLAERLGEEWLEPESAEATPSEREAARELHIESVGLAHHIPKEEIVAWASGVVGAEPGAGVEALERPRPVGPPLPFDPPVELDEDGEPEEAQGRHEPAVLHPLAEPFEAVEDAVDDEEEPVDVHGEDEPVEEALEDELGAWQDDAFGDEGDDADELEDGFQIETPDGQVAPATEEDAPVEPYLADVIRRWREADPRELDDVIPYPPDPVPAPPRAGRPLAEAGLPGLDGAFLAALAALDVTTLEELADAPGLDLAELLGRTYTQVARYQFLARRALAELEDEPLAPPEPPSTAGPGPESLDASGPFA